MGSSRMFEKLYLIGNEVKTVKFSCITSIGIGGKGVVVDSPDLKTFVETIRFLKSSSTPFRVMGMGTNLLVSDEGIDDVVVRTINLTGYEVVGDSIVAESGIPLKRLVRVALGSSLSGLEELYGIPGSLGGAVYMNAGAYGKEMKDVIEWVELLYGERVERLSPDDLGMSYRNGNVGGGIVLRVSLRLKRADADSIRKKMEHFLKKRLEKQPVFEKSAGSVFKRPREGFYVGKAVEELGLKGYRMGNVMVSEKHAGFIVNLGNGRFSDAVGLIDIIKKKVKDRYGVDLETEIVVWGK